MFCETDATRMETGHSHTEKGKNILSFSKGATKHSQNTLTGQAVLGSSHSHRDLKITIKQSHSQPLDHLITHKGLDLGEVSRFKQHTQTLLEQPGGQGTLVPPDCLYSLKTRKSQNNKQTARDC